MEHVLAAVAGLGIDNLIIETSTMEVPEGHDGSAAPIAAALLEAGLLDQDKPTRHIKVSKPVRMSHGDVELTAVPDAKFRITFTIEYDHPLIGVQERSIEITPDNFLKEIAPARTFVLERDLELLRQSGWIKGGRIESAIVVGKDDVLDDEKLRWPDEVHRHKILDLLGDLFILGGPLLGHVTAKRSGHMGHVAFVKRLKETLPLPGRRAVGRRGVGHDRDHGSAAACGTRSCSSIASRTSRRDAASRATRTSRSTNRSSMVTSRGIRSCRRCSSSRPWPRSAAC
jgi:UDP-3-O-acyl N-acetylglucosamine deacetylase